MENHYIRVDTVWSYNMIGGLEPVTLIDQFRMDQIFRWAGEYLKEVHLFHLSGKSDEATARFARFHASMSESLHGFQPAGNYFQFYFGNLFNVLSPVLGQIRNPIQTVIPITDTYGLVEAFIVSVVVN